jgi:hypothetical protein
MGNSLQIYIPSSSRPVRQKTIENLHPELWSYITIVVPSAQVEIYRKLAPEMTKVIPYDCLGIALKRQFILERNPTGKIIMMDDDLNFYKRNEEGRFRPAMTIDTIKMVTDILDLLEHYPYVGLVDKYFSDTRPRGTVECTRFNQVLGFNRDLLPDPWPRFRVQIHEEHDVHFQLLTRGIKTCVSTEWSKVDTPNAVGGCSEWRDANALITAGNQMVEYWPAIVSIRDKAPIGAHLRLNWRGAKSIGGL